MGKTLIPFCFPINLRRYPKITLIFWENSSIEILSESKKYVAGEIMFKFPDQMVSHADSFFIGHQIQALGIEDRLIPGETYFILPIDRFACKTLTTSSLLMFDSNSKQGHSKSTINFTGASSPPPFEYSQGFDGKILIKVSQDFIIRLIRGNDGNERGQYYSDCCKNSNPNNGICDTIELQKQYKQLVGSRDQIWSPKLETISEHKFIKYSPCNLLGFNLKCKEKKDGL